MCCFVSSFLNNSLALFSFILLHAAAAASVIDATPEETASVPRRRRKLVTKKTGALDAPLAYNWHNGGCPSEMNCISYWDYKCSPGEIYCAEGDRDTGMQCRLPLDPCYLRGPTEKACKTYLRGLPGCYWYPHGNEDQNGVGTCSISAGVSCGKHRASYCDQCPVYDYKDYGERYCNGDCKWHSTFWFFQPEYCEPK